jgi:hypothetical protein
VRSDADLRRVVQVWPDLSAASKRAILATLERECAPVNFE